MIPLLSIAAIGAVFLAMVFLNERWGLFASDRFANLGVKYTAYGWLGFFMLLLAFLVAGAAMRPPTPQELEHAPFYSLFALHAVFMVFLFGWWLLTGRPQLREFLNIPREGTGEAVMTGMAVGVAGWAFTIAMTLLIAAILQATGAIDQPEPSPMIGFMASMPLWKKMLIVLSAATVEEFFFRAWLQKRIGLIASTILFAVAHFTLGQPLLLIGVTVISLVIGFTFYRTKNLIPCMVAHGVFDAIQLFVIIPIAFRMTGA